MPSFFPWQYAVLAVVLVCASVTDVRSGKIPNWATAPAIGVGLLGHSLLWLLVDGYGDQFGLTPLGALAGLVAGLVPMFVAWKLGGVGAGWRFALATMFYGFAIAAVMAIVVMLSRRVAVETFKRVGRTLMLMLGPNKPGSPAGESSPTIPLGLALALGAAGALVEVLLVGPKAAKLALGF
jgi:prepilin peptidase CpaA